MKLVRLFYKNQSVGIASSSRTNYLDIKPLGIFCRFFVEHIA